MKSIHKRFLLLIITLILSFPLFAQLEVKEGSFKEVPGFVNINMEKMYDDNDKPYAVLKIKTENIGSKERRELNFGGDARTFFEVEYKDGEVWLYISYYASFIKISHEEHSSTEFYFPFDMKPKCGYEMTLINKFNYKPVPDKPDFNYLIIKADQANATISIDGQYAGEGQVAKSFKVGENHSWKIECDLYHTESGSTTIMKDTMAMTVEKTLRPAFGYVNIVTTPENGATVFVDNKKIGETPCKSDRLKSGEHTIRVMQEMFSTVEQTFVITDGNTTDLKINMSANFINVKVSTDKNSDIYIDNELVGKGSWSGRMTEGDHVFEARKESHRNSIQSYSFVLGKDETVVIPDPKPIYGSLDICTTPMGATIILDGKKLGTTPLIVNDVLIGNHELRLEKTDCATLEKMVEVKEDEMVAVNETLSDAKYVTISSDTKGDKIYVDGKYVGTSPVSTYVRYGEVIITAESNGIKEEQKFFINDNSNNNIKIIVGTKVFIDTYVYHDGYTLIYKHDKQEPSFIDDIYVDSFKIPSSIVKLSKGKHVIMTKRDGVKRKKTINIKTHDDVDISINTTQRRNWFGFEYIGFKKNHVWSFLYSVSSIGLTYERNVNQWLISRKWIENPKVKEGPTIGWALKSGIYYTDNKFADNDITVHYKSIDVPVLFRGYLGAGANQLLWIDCGPMLSYDIGDSKKYDERSNSISGLNMRCDVGFNFFLISVGYTVVVPLNNQKRTNGDSYLWQGIIVGISIDPFSLKDIKW